MKNLKVETKRIFCGKVFDLAIVAIFRNEAHIIREWLDHYIDSGIQHFYLIDNNSVDDYFPHLEAYIERGLVSLYKCEKDGYQIGAYNEILSVVREECAWVGAFDLDEFIYSPSGKSLPSILKDFQDYETVLIPWLSFGSSFLIEQPDFVVPSFLYRGPAEISRSFLKAISRPTSIVNFSQHNPQTRNSSKILSNGMPFGSEHFIRLEEHSLGDYKIINNHYRLQSLNFFTKIKTTRPEVNERVANDVKHMNFFIENDRHWNSVYDSRLADQIRLRRLASGNLR